MRVPGVCARHAFVLCVKRLGGGGDFICMRLIIINSALGDERVSGEGVSGEAGLPYCSPLKCASAAAVAVILQTLASCCFLYKLQLLKAHGLYVRCGMQEKNPNYLTLREKNYLKFQVIPPPQKKNAVVDAGIYQGRQTSGCIFSCIGQVFLKARRGSCWPQSFPPVTWEEYVFTLSSTFACSKSTVML